METTISIAMTILNRCILLALWMKRLSRTPPSVHELVEMIPQSIKIPAMILICVMAYSE